LIDLTGGLPLFVLNAISVAESDYDGSLKQLCADLAQSAHTREVAQDLILGRVFDRLPKVVADIAELLSLCDAPLRRTEIQSYIAVADGSDQASFDRALRQLVSQGLLQVFADDRIKLHDAARAVGKGRLLLREGHWLVSLTHHDPLANFRPSSTPAAARLVPIDLAA
jgi:hypothetical protein